MSDVTVFENVAVMNNIYQPSKCNEAKQKTRSLEMPIRKIAVTKRLVNGEALHWSIEKNILYTSKNFHIILFFD